MPRRRVGVWSAVVLWLLLLSTPPTACDGVAGGGSAGYYTLHSAYHGYSRHARARLGGQLSALHVVYAGVRVSFPSVLMLRSVLEESPIMNITASPPGAATVPSTTVPSTATSGATLAMTECCPDAAQGFIWVVLLRIS